ncbi:MAG: hypothetical protein P4L69_04750 [Desulfosporosinus sp.]|nr:hypothetical protein [Desulfosporosinus sp.]
MEQTQLSIVSLVDPETREINEIIQLYRERISVNLSLDDKEGLRELYYHLKSRQIDAYDYLKDAISVFAKKSKDKQNLSYLIGMVRHWTILGKWSMPTTEDQQLIEVFKQETGIEPSVETRQTIIRMVSKYGSIKLSQYMTKVFNDKTELDISKFHIQRVIDRLEKQ